MSTLPEMEKLLSEALTEPGTESGGLIGLGELIFADSTPNEPIPPKRQPQD